MDLNLSLEETQFRDELRAWLEQHAPKDWEHRRDGSIEQHFAFLRSWQKTLYDGGWAGISWPRRVRRARRQPHAAGDFLAGAGAGERTADGQRASASAWSVPPSSRSAPRRRRRVSSGHSQRRGDLVPGFLGAERRVRPGRAAERRRVSTANTSSSTGRRCGRAMAGRRTGASSSCAPIPPCRSTRASR